MTVPLAGMEGRNELGVTVDGNEGVSIPELFGIVVCEPSLLLANVTPNLVKLNPFGVDVDKVLVHDFEAERSPARIIRRMMVSRWIPVIRSIERMEAPSTKLR